MRCWVDWIGGRNPYVFQVNSKEREKGLRKGPVGRARRNPYVFQVNSKLKAAMNESGQKFTRLS